MAAIGVPALPARKPLLPRAVRRLRKLAGTVATAVVTPHKAALGRLADIPLTCAGVAGIDFAAFHWAHSWGFLVTGVSLIIVEHLIADSE